MATFARMVCGVLDLAPSGGSDGGAHRALLHSLHALFALYLEFSHNPAVARYAQLHSRGGGPSDDADAAAAAGSAAVAGGVEVVGQDVQRLTLC